MILVTSGNMFSNIKFYVQKLLAPSINTPFITKNTQVRLINLLILLTSK